MSAPKTSVRSGTITTPPPSPVRDPRNPAAKAAQATTALKARVFNDLIVACLGEAGDLEREFGPRATRAAARVAGPRAAGCRVPPGAEGDGRGVSAPRARVRRVARGGPGPEDLQRRGDSRANAARRRAHRARRSCAGWRGAADRRAREGNSRALGLRSQRQDGWLRQVGLQAG